MDEELDSLLDDLEPALALAFLAAIALLRSGINYTALIIALRAGDIDAAIEALNIDRGAFSGYLMERQGQFAKAGAVSSEGLTQDKAKSMAKDAKVPVARSPVLEPPVGRGPLDPEGLAPSPAIQPGPAPWAPAVPGAPTPPALPPRGPSIDAGGGTTIVFRFDMTNPRAEAKIRTEAASRVTGYVDEQIETARRVIADGFARGEGPQTIATDIAGRINRISGRREGGIVGLSDPQVGYVDSMRARLLSGDPDEMMKVLGRFKDGKWVPGTGQTLRDRRYDATIKKAIKDVAAGKPNPLTADKIDEMAAKYSDRLLARRAEDIARTETAQGVEMARAEATKQALEKAGLDDNAVTKGWIHQGGIRHARDGHLAMNGKTVVGIDTPFHLPDGSVMQYPHDPAGGVKNNANCRCRGDQEIDWAFGL